MREIHNFQYLRTCWFWPQSAPKNDLLQALTQEHRNALFSQYCRGRGDGSQKPREFAPEALADLQSWGFATATGLTMAGERVYQFLVSTAQD
jgi:hypothetical protein